MNLMSSLSVLPLVGLAALVSLAPAQDQSAREPQLRESDHKKYGKLVGDYFEALDEEKDINETMQKILDEIEKSEKRMKGASMLAAVADWEQIFRLATEDRLKGDLKKRGAVTETRLKSPRIQSDISIAYRTPKRAPKEALPLILIACDSGESPAAHIEKHWNDETLQEAAYLVAIDLGSDTDSWGVFGSPEAPGGPWILMTALGLLQQEFPVDTNKTFLVGSGRGFVAALATAAVFPQVFAGLIGVGEVAVADKTPMANLRTVPSLLLGGGDGAKAIEAKAGELGYANCIIDPEGGVARAWEWIGATSRDAYPAQLTYSPPNDYARTVHWLSLGGFQSAEGPKVEATIDREKNTVTIQAEKVADLVVYLNDALVKLDEPVSFVVNGTMHEQVVTRNAPEMVRRQYQTGDWGRVFTAYVQLDVPAK